MDCSVLVSDFVAENSGFEFRHPSYNKKTLNLLQIKGGISSGVGRQDIMLKPLTQMPPTKLIPFIVFMKRMCKSVWQSSEVRK